MDNTEMDYKKKYTVGEVAELFKIPKSTLRYWDFEKLTFMERNETNDYREYSLNDIIDISDIVFYRSINIPIAKLKNLYQMDLLDFEQILGETQEAVEKQIHDLQLKRESILRRKEKLSQIRMMKEQPYFESYPDIEKMIRFDISHFYSQDPYDFAIFIERTDKLKIQYGSVVSPNEEKENLIWQRHGKEAEKNTKYLEVLIKVSPEDTSINNVSEQMEALSKRGFQIRKIIGRYFITAVDLDGIRYDFFKGWAEVC